MVDPPRLPGEMLLRYTDVPEGRIRARVLGERRPGVPPVLVIQGMAVSDYLLPACAVLGTWTQATLLDVPGYGGSGEPTRYLDVRGYGEAVAHWLAETGTEQAVVVGHSSGTQVAAWAGVLCPERVAGVGLASPTVDPATRGWARLAAHSWLDRRSPAPGLQATHVPEWKRAGVRGFAHLVRVHLKDSLEDQLSRLTLPVLLLRAERDRLSTDAWVSRLAGLAPHARTARMPGAHPFVWTHPDAWSAPLRDLADRARSRT